jgi:hypothetical protein
MALCPSWAAYGTLGDCLILVMNAVGLALQWLMMLYGYLYFYRKHFSNKLVSSSSLLQQSLLRDDYGRENDYATLPARYPGGTVFLRAVQIIAAFQFVQESRIPAGQAVVGQSRHEHEGFPVRDA